MYNIIKKQYEIESYHGESYTTVDFTSIVYNNGTYNIDLILTNSDPYAFGNDEDYCSDETRQVITELFDAVRIDLYDIMDVMPVHTINVSFSIDEKDIIIRDNQLFFPENKLKNFKMEYIKTGIYQADSNTHDMSSLLSTGDKTSILLNHPKGKEIFTEIENISKHYNMYENNGTTCAEFYPFEMGFNFEEV